MTTNAELSKLLWEARERVEMFSDVVERQSGRPDRSGRSVVARLDAYRVERGWNPNGFGGEE